MGPPENGAASLGFGLARTAGLCPAVGLTVGFPLVSTKKPTINATSATAELTAAMSPRRLIRMVHTSPCRLAKPSAYAVRRRSYDAVSQLLPTAIELRRLSPAR